MKMRVFTAWLAALMALAAFAGTTLADTAALPDDLEVIEDNAFYGDTSLWEVRLPSGLRSIGSRAFADSSVKKISFPSSIEYIAPDAFDGCHEVLAQAVPGTAAYTYVTGHSSIFRLDTSLGWQSLMAFPSASEISDHNATSSDIAPYIDGWMATGSLGRFTEYAIDFKADYVPDYTYCCLGNFYLDYSSLYSQYTQVQVDVSGYAGFQQTSPGKMPNSIMAFWEVYCWDAAGQMTTIRAKRVYPAEDGDTTFTGEGDGVHCLVDYNWRPGQWYRMLLQCRTSESTGNTCISQWVQDLSNGAWTYLCEYDLGVPNVAFTGDIAVFLENYIPVTSGNVRTMEVRNVRALKEGSNEWTSIRSGWFEMGYVHTGSYRYGVNGDTFWIITTGIPGKAGTPQSSETLTVSGGSSAWPY